jgi:hypothetical protein
MRVFAYRSGHLMFVEGPMQNGVSVADGALLVAHGPADIVGPTVRAAARLAYDNETYLVPGCPEAESDDEAFKAFTKWFDWVQSCLNKKGVYLSPPAKRRRKRK